MNNNDLQEWWDNAYRHYQLNHAFSLEEQQFIALKYNRPVSNAITIISGLKLRQQVLNSDYNTTEQSNRTNTLYDDDIHDNAVSSLTLLFIAISYGLVVFGGVLGNITLLLTLCSASSVRLRNPLLLAVCIADLFVTGISAPLTLLNLVMNRKTKSLPLTICKIIHFGQVMPVAASTISLFLLSLDRYATVKHSRLAQLRQRRYLHTSLAIISWLTSAVISTPFLFAYTIIAKTVKIKNDLHRSGDKDDINNSNSILLIPNENSRYIPIQSPNISISCNSDLDTNNVFVTFLIFHTFAVFIIPGVGVLLNHFGVRQKLCALSLTARAAHGELPLPMPILRRQTHMVIVTGIAQQAAECGAPEHNSTGPDIQLRHLSNSINVPSTRKIIKSPNPISPRAMREIRAHSQRQRISYNQGSCGPAAPGIPLPQTSTLRSRRHLANMLIASAVIFILCWTPHVFCIFYTNLGYKGYCSKTSTYFSLLLGYMYSAISPVIYWVLNHNTLRQSPSAPILRLRFIQKFLRSRLRSNTVPPPPSSTNEAALGAFNPKLIKLTPKQYRAQASSNYLY